MVLWITNLENSLKIGSNKFQRPGMERFYGFWRDQQGQDIVEYSIIVTFIAIACLALLATPQSSITALWTKGSNTLVSANTNLAGS
jgi:Flp pilus assembly pilin Flp